MAKTKKVAKKATLKKDLRAHVSQSLESMFKEFESIVGKRKFQKNIKKASKILVTSVKPTKVKLAAKNAEETEVHEPFLNNEVTDKSELAF
jgi:hypothetical protein